MYDPDTAPHLPWWYRLLSHSFRVGRFFGVTVRIYSLGLIVLPLMLVPTGLPPWWTLGDRLIYLGGAIVWIYATIWLHEMGHIWAGWRYHIRTSLITISPLGGLAHLTAPAPSPRSDIVISLAGPATHLLQLAVLWPLSHLIAWTPEPGPMLVHLAFGLNLIMLLFNLLPCYPMDGGCVLRGLLAMRMHPNKAVLWTANVGLVGAAGFIVWAIVGVGSGMAGLGGGVLVAIAITNISACLRARLEARYGDGPYGERRQAWEQDADAWKYGAEAEPREPAPPRVKKAAKVEGPGEEELDRLLDRVREVGLANLTEREREALRQASQARRGSR